MSKPVSSAPLDLPSNGSTARKNRPRKVLDGNIRILIEPSEYSLLNAGDAAMMRVAVARLRSLWPNATIEVLTNAPDRVLRYCPSALPLPAAGRDAWVADGCLMPQSLYRRLPQWFKNPYVVFERRLKRRFAAGASHVLRARLRRHRDAMDDFNRFFEAASNADLVVVTGMGGITDAFADYCFDLLQSLELALVSGAAVVMVGQGFGPINDPAIRARAAAVLAKIDFISLREGLHSPALLQALGFPASRFMVTGDDAIEVAYASRQERLGGGLGINLRFAEYAQLQAHHVDRIGPILQQASRDLGAPLVPVPVSHISGEADAETIGRLLRKPEDRAGAEEIDAPLDVIERIRRCRVVVTGSYHAGVFTLSMGVPVIGLASSEYYRVKFAGLAHQFGSGCKVIDLGDAEFPAHLQEAIGRCWESADEFRPDLLEKASRQIELGRTAFQRIYEIANRRWRAGSPTTPILEGVPAPAANHPSS